MPHSYTLRPSLDSDGPWIAELRAVSLRDDLERLGRFDPVRVRRRFLDSFRPELPRVIDVDARRAGCITVRPEPDAVWIEHFYLEPAFHGQGVGVGVLRDVMAGHAGHQPFRLNVLQGSAARRLYERHGFAVESEDTVDVFTVAKRVRRRLGGQPRTGIGACRVTAGYEPQFDVEAGSETISRWHSPGISRARR